MMKCISSRFGTFDVQEHSILTFPCGLLGFPDHHRYIMLDHDTDAPFKWLQSLEDPELAFVIIDPVMFHSNYRITISPEALTEVQGKEGEDLAIAVILTIPSGDPGQITANLRGPLLMNHRTRLCKQLVLADEFPTRHPLFPASGVDLPEATQRSQAAGCSV